MAKPDPIFPITSKQACGSLWSCPLFCCVNSTDDYELIALVLSCLLAGVAGSTKALVFDIATLTDVHCVASADVVLMTM